MTPTVGAPPAASPGRALLRRPAALLRGHRAVAALTAVALAWYLTRGILDHLRYVTTGYDLGIFDQAVRAYAHFQAPVVPLKGPGYNVLGDHFHPIIAVLAPLYWIWDTPLVLVIAQAVLIAASVPVVYRFTRRRTGQGLSLVVAGAYAFGWPVQSLIDFDFHEIAFAQPLLAFAIDALDRRRYRAFVAWTVPLLFVREDLGVIVLLLAFLWWCQRRRPWWPPVALAAAGVAGYLLATAYVIPHFAPGTGYAYGDQYGELGDSLSQAMLHVFTEPLTALRLLFNPIVKTYMLLYLFVPVAFLALRSRYVILAVPLLVERLFNSRGNLWQPHFHYNALPWLVLVLAMVDGAARLGLFARGPVWARRARIALAAWLIAFPLFLIGNPFPVHPTSLNHMRDNSIFWNDDRVSADQAVVAYLPANTCVDAANDLVPHLTPRNYVTVPHPGAQHADFVALDLSAKDVGGNDGPKPAPVLKAVEAHGYRVVFRRGPLVVLRSPDYAGPSTECGPLGSGKAG